ncbi:hypothetical protein NL676_036962 [Syzygium grande]|nr:hypothetical protein NL676_036962 [Syzygium grande]
MGSTPHFLSHYMKPTIDDSRCCYGEIVPNKIVRKAVEVVVEGMVYCQICKYFGMWSLAEAKPVGSAKVSVIRKNYKNRVTYWKTFRAEESSYFYAELKGYEMSHSILDHPLQA